MAATMLLPACGEAAPPGPPVIDAQAFDHAVPTEFDPAAIVVDEAVFDLGVQAGAMHQGSAVLWCHAQGAPHGRLRVWRPSEVPGQVALVKDEPWNPNAQGYGKALIDGLAPATWYHYAFFSEDLSKRSAIGRFRTAFPEDWQEPLTFGATACTNFRYQPYQALELTAQQPIDLFLQLGDMSYNDSASTLEDFRALWRKTLQDPGYRAVLSQVGMYATWDDHETINDLDPEQLSASDPQRLAYARQTFTEALAVPQGPTDALWTRFRWGKTAEFFVLDCRSERKPSTRESDQAQYLSRAQMDWLKASLKASPSHFKVILNSVPITHMPPPLWGLQADRWQGYPAAREELLSFIDQEAIDNVWFVAGDFHLGLVTRLERQGERRRMWEIAVGPGGNRGNPLAILLEGPEENREVGFPRAQFDYASGDIAATTITLDPKANAVTVRFLDPETGALRYEKTLRQGD